MPIISATRPFVQYVEGKEVTGHTRVSFNTDHIICVEETHSGQARILTTSHPTVVNESYEAITKALARALGDLELDAQEPEPESDPGWAILPAPIDPYLETR